MREKEEIKEDIRIIGKEIGVEMDIEEVRKIRTGREEKEEMVVCEAKIRGKLVENYGKARKVKRNGNLD